MKNPTDHSPSPIAIDEITEHPDVHDFFQTDVDFQMVHSTSKKAERAKQHTVAAIDWATALARKAGLPAPDSIIASSSKKKFMLFSIGLNDENSGADEEDHSECRVFGLITKPEASSSAMEDFLTAQY